MMIVKIRRTIAMMVMAMTVIVMRTMLTTTMISFKSMMTSIIGDRDILGQMRINMIMAAAMVFMITII